MPRPDDITATIRHWAPVRMRWRAGLPERIALDPMDTAVAIRGVDPDALEPRRVPLGRYKGCEPRHVELLAMDGVLWERLSRLDEDDRPVPVGLADGLAILAGAHGEGPSPFRARIPEHHRIGAHPGERPIPPPTRRRAGEAFHAVAADRIRLGARRDLAHDGRSILVAVDQPLLRWGKANLAQVNWAALGTAEWRPMFRHDRTDDLYAMLRTMGKESEIPEARQVKEPLAAGIAEAVRGVEVRDDDLRRFVNQAAFIAADCLEGYKADVPRPDGVGAALDRLCALAAIDAVGPDLRAATDLIAGVVKEGAGRIGGDWINHRYNDGMNGLRGAAFLLDRYIGLVVRPRLAGAPVPEADADALGALAP